MGNSSGGFYSPRSYIFQSELVKDAGKEMAPSGPLTLHFWGTGLWCCKCPQGLCYSHAELQGHDRQGQERLAHIQELCTAAQSLGSGLSAHFPHFALLTSRNGVNTQKAWEIRHAGTQNSGQNHPQGMFHSQDLQTLSLIAETLGMRHFPPPGHVWPFLSIG